MILLLFEHIAHWLWLLLNEAEPRVDESFDIFSTIDIRSSKLETLCYQDSMGINILTKLFFQFSVCDAAFAFYFQPVKHFKNLCLKFHQPCTFFYFRVINIMVCTYKV